MILQHLLWRCEYVEGTGLPKIEWKIPNSVELYKQGLISISLQENQAVIRLMPCPDIGQMSYSRERCTPRWTGQSRCERGDILLSPGHCHPVSNGSEARGETAF